MAEEEDNDEFEDVIQEGDFNPVRGEEAPPEAEKPRFVHGGSGGADRRRSSHLWLVSYSDFMTILMIFFLAMYGHAYMAKAKVYAQRGQALSYSDFSRAMHNLKGKLNHQIEIKEDLRKIVFQLPEGILFSSGKAVLTEDAQLTLAEFAESAKLVTGDIVVEGHTDNVPMIGGQYPSNWELSAARAFSVIEALVNNGVAQSRLSAWGFGENRPMVPNTNLSSRAKNRRIEIILLKKVEVAAEDAPATS